MCAVAAGGDDMSPSINRGESLRIESVSPGEVRLGDVIVFKRQVLIGHRVMGMMRFAGDFYFMARGDRCPYIDSPVSGGALIGIVTGKRIPIGSSVRHRFLFASMLLWYVPASKHVRGSAFRRVNALMRRAVSYKLPKVP